LLKRRKKKERKRRERRLSKQASGCGTFKAVIPGY